MTRKFLITGGAGNVGSALAKRLVQDENNFVCVVDNLSTGAMHKLPNLDTKNFKFIQADVNDFDTLASIFLQNPFDYVFHYAAVVGVQRTLENPLLVLNDIEGIKNILKLSSYSKVKRIYFSSSSEVYGEPIEFPQNENTTPLNSKLPYSIVKNLGEAYFKSYHASYGLDYTIFRFFNTYGENQSTDFVIPKFIELAKNNLPITIYGDGSQTRTFCYVDDNIATTLATLDENKGINDVINIGSDVEISVLDLAKEIIRLTNSSSEIKHLPALKEGDMTRRKPDISKMKSILNRPMVTLEDGLKKLIALS
ncbi:MAG: NAD-dependent epimerase/dehydratase family protein [Saprospiraceae bacterium]|jgi:UDP-glucose 4-epimerase|nr:NAD-dependent epimerase/dehydratase family protein [Saprospiraceae bacterium]